MTLSVPADATSNIIIQANIPQLNAYGSSIIVSGANIISATGIATGDSPTVSNNALNTKVYTIGIVPPSVLVTDESTGSSMYTFKVHITNNDTSTGITLSGMLGSTQLSLVNTGAVFGGTICLENTIGGGCTDSGITVPGSFSSSFPATTASFIDKNSSADFYLSV